MKKRKKALLCLSILTHAVFWGSLASSLLGKPLCPNKKGNIVLLALLGTTATVFTIALFFSKQNKQLKGDDMIGEGIHIASTAKSKLINGVSYLTSPITNAIYTRIYGSTETGQSLQKGSTSLIKELYKTDGKETTRLGGALKTLKLGGILILLDQSLLKVEKGAKSKEEHKQYYKDLVERTFRNLSLAHHPDKSGSNDDAQRMINDVWQAMRKIHKYAMEKKHADKKYEYIYRSFDGIPINIINNEQSICRVNSSVSSKLYYLSRWEEGDLMEKRNSYVCRVEKFPIRFLQTNLASIKSMFNSNSMRLDNIRSVYAIIKESEKKFYELCSEYKEAYKQHWLDNLKSLNEECKNCEELKVIKPEVEKLLEEAKEQYRMLAGYKSNKMRPDEVFVEPMLKYTDLVNIYYKFTLKLCKDIESCYYTLIWGYQFDDYNYNKQKFVVGDKETEFTQKSKEYINGLSHQDLFGFLNLMMNFYFHKKNKEELQRKVREYYDSKLSTKEIGSILIFALNQLSKLYQEEFQWKETLLLRENRESAERSMKLEVMNIKLEADIARILARTAKKLGREEEALGREEEVQALEEVAQVIEEVAQADIKIPYASSSEEYKGIKARREEAAERRHKAQVRLKRAIARVSGIDAVTAAKKADQAEEENIKLKEMLKRAGIDPDSDLNNINIEPGTSYASEVDMDC